MSQNGASGDSTKESPGDSDETSEAPELEPGMTVVDCEDSDPNLAVVINRPSCSCDEWDAYYDQDKDRHVTVAEDNPDYDPKAPVIVVAFRGDLAEARPEKLPVTETLRLSNLDCPYYSFPPGRLRIVDDENTISDSDLETNSSDEDDAISDVENEQNNEEKSETGGGSSSKSTEADTDHTDKQIDSDDLSPELSSLRDRLAESATVTVEHDNDGIHLEVEKLGSVYQVYTDGTISGGGPLRDRLTPIVDEYLSDEK